MQSRLTCSRHAARAGVCAAVLALSRAGGAVAASAEVNATADLQFYSFRSPYGEPVIFRRRYTQTLALSVHDIYGSRIEPGPNLSFQARLRLDGDFGQLAEERDPKSSRFVPGLLPAPLDLMYAYLAGEGLCRGYLGFRLGRQYTVDALGFWSFDGGLVTLDTPIGFKFHGFAGFEQRNLVQLLGSSRFAADGVFRGERQGLDSSLWPSYLEESALAPAFGASLESTSLGFFHSKLSYRNVQNRSAVRVSSFVDPRTSMLAPSGTRTSSERLGYSARITAGDVGTALGAVVYDLYLGRFSEYWLNLETQPVRALTLGLDFDYYHPTFDADSIFNWFPLSETRRGTARASLALTDFWDFAASTGLRSSSGSEGKAPFRRFLDLISSLDLRYRGAPAWLTLRALAETGERGHRIGGDVTARRVFGGGFYDSLLVLSLYDWRDALRPERAATSFSYVLGVGARPGLTFFSAARFGLEWEHATSKLVGQRFRVLMTMDLSVFK